MAVRDPAEFYERLGAVTRCLRAAAAQAYAAFDLGTAQAKLLRHIGRSSRLSQADLARATRTAPTLTGRALEPLIEKGWVRRKRSEADRREYLLELSAAGRRLCARVEAARGAIIAQVGEALDERDRADFERIAGKILAAFEGAAAGSSAEP
ncbi:MAG TPA: MarR family transcriptional regulator [Myxococcales bacterium]|nr:MarR family transcriptional regulator [Myxococcales bacterium]